MIRPLRPQDAARGPERGGAMVLLMVGVLTAGCTLLAVGRAASMATDRARADLVAEAVVASAASDRVRGLDAASAAARARALARIDGTSVVRLVEVEGRIEATVSRHGELGRAVASLTW